MPDSNERMHGSVGFEARAWLPHNRVLDLHAVAMALGLHASRDVLLAGVDSAVAGSLPSATDPASQLLSDLGTLNKIRTLDGEAPLATWLRNAITLRSAHQGSDILRETLLMLDADVAQSLTAVVSRVAQDAPATPLDYWKKSRTAAADLPRPQPATAEPTPSNLLLRDVRNPHTVRIVAPQKGLGPSAAPRGPDIRRNDNTHSADSTIDAVREAHSALRARVRPAGPEVGVTAGPIGTLPVLVRATLNDLARLPLLAWRAAGNPIAGEFVRRADRVFAAYSSFSLAAVSLEARLRSVVRKCNSQRGLDPREDADDKVFILGRNLGFSGDRLSAMLGGSAATLSARFEPAYRSAMSDQALGTLTTNYKEARRDVTSAVSALLSPL